MIPINSLRDRLQALLAVAGVLALVFGGLANASDYSDEQEVVLALGSLTAVEEIRDADGQVTSIAAGELKAIYFDALEFKGHPTRVYAWLGLPEGASSERPVPGVVLVHGGGGTAFKDWVRMWNERGYAAISIAVEGQIDERVPDIERRRWIRHEWPGPSRQGIYADSGEALTDQWMYHAVADSILANSLLRSLPEVDAEKVGIKGISWGGIITSTVIGIDTRFTFAIPTYGCGGLHEIDNQYSAALADNDQFQNVWDPLIRIGRATMPALWLSWPGDKHFSLDAQAATYTGAPGTRMVSLVPGMRHGHPPAWLRPESYDFADSIVATGLPWCSQTKNTIDGSNVEVEFSCSKSLEEASLMASFGGGHTGSRDWIESDAELSREPNGSWTVNAAVPPGASGWFVNVKADGRDSDADGDGSTDKFGYNDRQLVASSDYREIDLPDSAPEASFPNVLILGDSISIGYTPVVKELLSGVANVWRPDANTGDTRRGLENLESWLGDNRWDVIHFNWGLHDLAYRHPESKVRGRLDKVNGSISVPLDDYKANLENLVVSLQNTGANLIWASTTYVPEGEPGRVVGDELKYNEAARTIMLRHSVVINDLHTKTSEMAAEFFVKPGDVHYTTEGYSRIATQVVQQIKAALPAVAQESTEGSGVAGSPEMQRLGTQWQAMNTSAAKQRGRNRFIENKYGMFIHWGLSSTLGGIWKGETMEDGGVGPTVAEWIMRRKSIPRAEYADLARTFNPQSFDADEWVAIAKAAGMKYIVITAKHHEGFAMFDSSASDFNIVDATPFGRDIIRELEQASLKAGLAFGVYYSHGNDWMDGGDLGMKDYGPEEPERPWVPNYHDPAPATFDEYIANKALPQVRELSKNYALSQVWFDGQMYMPPQMSFDFYQAVYDANPEILANSRIGNGFGDIRTPRDNEIPDQASSNIWEGIATTNNSWGYKSYDSDWKSPIETLYWLVASVSKGGNFLLNVGPDGNGTIPPGSVENLLEVGKWLQVNGDAIYGTRHWKVQHEGPTSPEMNGTNQRKESGFSIDFKSNDVWFTQKGGKVYVIALARPDDDIVSIKALSGLQISGIELLGESGEVRWLEKSGAVEITLPKFATVGIGYALVVDLNEPKEETK